LLSRITIDFLCIIADAKAIKQLIDSFHRASAAVVVVAVAVFVYEFVE
jgi:hypothetical protein